ncbi:hypothetical protein SAMN05216420_1079 [Nitrosospira sp. Nl5]|uniref:hypothetical protein n=1 Tax=Nitrosospira sp. Nl5 TaxID=200120 RepID=UPI00088C875B|nr:hypothetical protein [Nitrosospira sp. Nl5]SCY47111.1 hypothetical protein SAMN05216420_1079 [Nitrosospira sp. Nl5]
MNGWHAWYKLPESLAFGRAIGARYQPLHIIRPTAGCGMDTLQAKNKVVGRRGRNPNRGKDFKRNIPSLAVCDHD